MQEAKELQDSSYGGGGVTGFFCSPQHGLTVFVQEKASRACCLHLDMVPSYYILYNMSFHRPP